MPDFSLRGSLNVHLAQAKNDLEAYNIEVGVVVKFWCGELTIQKIRKLKIQGYPSAKSLKSF